MKPALNNILLIDDSNNDLELTQYHLNKHFNNLLFMIAKSKADFMERLSWVKPDLVISDFELPDCNGLELLFLVREKYHNIPFIFISGTLKDHDLISKAILNGANGYVLKDNMNKLPEVVKHIMEKEELKVEHQLDKQLRLSRLKLNINKAINLSEECGDELKAVISELKKDVDELDK